MLKLERHGGRRGFRLGCGSAALRYLLELDGVGDGIRTRNVQSHSLALYQLSYTHHIGAWR